MHELQNTLLKLAQSHYLFNISLTTVFHTYIFFPKTNNNNIGWIFIKSSNDQATFSLLYNYWSLYSTPILHARCSRWPIISSFLLGGHFGCSRHPRNSFLQVLIYYRGGKCKWKFMYGLGKLVAFIIIVKLLLLRWW